MYGMWQGVLTETYFSGTYAVSLPDKLLFVFFENMFEKEGGREMQRSCYEAYREHKQQNLSRTKIP